MHLEVIKFFSFVAIQLLSWVNFVSYQSFSPSFFQFKMELYLFFFFLADSRGTAT